MGLMTKLGKTLLSRPLSDAFGHHVSASPRGSLPISWSVVKRLSTDVKSIEELDHLLNQPEEGAGSEVRRQALKVEFDYFSYMGDNLPSVITEEMWEEVMEIESAEARRHCWATFHRRELSKNMSLHVRRRMARHRHGRMLDRVRAVEGEDYEGEVYDEIGKNKGGIPLYLLPRINASFIKPKHDNRLNYAYNLGQNFVLDLSPHLPMDAKTEAIFRGCLFSIYSENRIHWEPFNISLCNYDPDYGPAKRFVESDLTQNYHWNVSSQCFTEMFPLDKIVYLTADSPKKLTTYQHDDIYVISATSNICSSRENLAKVKEYNLRSAQLNLDPYLIRQRGASTFSTRQIFRVLKDARDTEGNWPYAFRHLVKGFNSPVRWRAKYRYMERSFPDSKRFPRRNSVDGFAAEDFDEDLESHQRKLIHMFRNERSIFKPRNKEAVPDPNPLSEHSEPVDADFRNPPSVSIDENPSFSDRPRSRHFKDGPPRLQRNPVPSLEFWTEIDKMDEELEKRL